MREKEYRCASAVRSGLLFMEGVPGVAFGDQVMIRDQQGRKRNGQVILSSDETVMVQVFEGTTNLSLDGTWVRFLEQPLEMALSPELLGRIFNGIGKPLDDRPPIISRLRRNVNGQPVNPAARAYP
ncbi:MAG TPA: V-type ATP synthase subunit B, partial [Chromatiaceae bacterium]|nr:V-type ATP synthase subunit B [Chromatiaceae bacterium]